VARVLKQDTPKVEVAVVKHDCGATVEFEWSDIKHDRDGDYVVCPSCSGTPWINVSALKWKKRK